MNAQVALVFTTFLYVLIAAVIVRSLLSWFPISPRNQFALIIHRVTEPLLDPVRRILPRTGMIDFSGMVVVVLLYVMVLVVNRAAAG